MDIRKSQLIMAEVLEFIRMREMQDVALLDFVFGCRHEEGIDYPDSEPCPRCLHWAGRDRLTGKIRSLKDG